MSDQGEAVLSEHDALTRPGRSARGTQAGLVGMLVEHAGSQDSHQFERGPAEGHVRGSAGLLFAWSWILSPLLPDGTGRNLQHNQL